MNIFPILFKVQSSLVAERRIKATRLCVTVCLLPSGHNYVRELSFFECPGD